MNFSYILQPFTFPYFSPWTMFFDKSCRMVELHPRTKTTAGDDEAAPGSAKSYSYRIPQNLRDAGITPDDIDNVEQLIEHNLIMGVSNSLWY